MNEFALTDANRQVVGDIVTGLDEALTRYCREASAGDVSALNRLAKIRNWFEKEARPRFDKCIEAAGVNIEEFKKAVEEEKSEKAEIRKS